MKQTIFTLLLLCAVSAMAVPMPDSAPRLMGRLYFSDDLSPGSGLQVMLFDLNDLRPVYRGTTDEKGQFAIELANAEALPGKLHLLQNFPNPFNPSTLIPYQLKRDIHVRLEVFNVLGQRIRTLVDEVRPAGTHRVAWDARDEQGRGVAAGVYIYRLTMDGISESRRMLLTDGGKGMASSFGSVTRGPSASAEETGVYGITVSGPGIATYVQTGIRPGEGELRIAVEKVRPGAAAKTAVAALLGDVNGDGRVSIVDALVIATYGVDASIAAPNGGDIALGDVNGDGQINIVDALMVATYGVDPTNADLPTGIGELVEGRNQLPVLVVPAAQKVREGEDLLLHVQVSDPDGDQVALSVAGNPEGSFLAGKTFSWSPAGGQAGEYEIVFTADDGSGGTVSETVAVSVKRGSQLTVALTDSTTMEFVWIEPGTFVMGTTSEQQQTLNDKGLWDKQYKAELPAHEVTISRGFWLGKYEVTQSQWESVMGQGYWSGKWSRYQDEYVRADPIHPAVYISWEDVQSFVHALNETAGDSLYRLPTEAEWEYACRAGSNTLWSSGNDENLMGDYAWYDETAGNVGLLYAQPVGQKLPNSWGLYDMHGNVGEWVQDWYGNYSDSTSVDPQNSAEGSFRVWRGGATVSQNRNVRSARRFGNVQESSSIVGARLLRIK